MVNPTALKAHQIHLWHADLSQPTSQVEALVQLLSPDERQRAGRFHFERHRQRYIVGRGVLRRLLGTYLDTDPAALEFGYGEHGKPFLRHAGPLRFNVSNSHTLALLAFAQGRELGVDVERIRPEVAQEQIAERFFSPREVAALNALPTAMIPEGFFNCWTRKEAYIKALGKGLTLALDSFAVELSPEAEAQLLWVKDDLTALKRWRLVDVAVASGYKGALCAEGQDWQLRTFMWRPDVT